MPQSPQIDDRPAFRVGDVRPIPDPTELTNRAVAQVEQRTDAKLEALKTLLQVQIQCVKDLVETEIDRTNALKEEKFANIWKNFEQLEKHRVEGKHDAEMSIAAALQARREASDKSDEALKEQVNQLRVAGDATATNLRRDIDGNKDTILSRMEQNRAAADGRISAIENRVTTVEQRKEGARENSQDQIARVAAIAGWVMAAIAIIGWVSSHNIAPITFSSQPGQQQQQQPRIEVR